MNFWTIENLARIARGETAHWQPMEPIAQAIEARPSSRPVAGPFGASIDTRSVLPGQIFIALKGENVDGHQFVAEAARRGASMAIVSDAGAITPAPPADFPIVVVSDPLAAMARLAATYRDSLTRTLVVAVTGSAGKTTTTRLIAAALGGSGRLRGTHPSKSFNNAIGVPLTILNARPDDEFLVCEVGTSAPGEIEALARIVRPDVAVITSIGRAHAEFLGGTDGVAREKSALLRHVRGADGLALIPIPCEALEPFVGDTPHLRRFGRGGRADLRLGRVEMPPEGVRFEVEGSGWFSLPMLGEHNAMNALAAVAVARHAGLSDEEIRSGLATARGASMRLERRRIGEIEVINDAYNANPESMRAAIQTLAAVGVPGGGRRVLVLGDMLELGSQSAAAHDEVMGEVARLGGAFGLVWAVGEQMARGSESLGRAGFAGEVRREPQFDQAAAARVAASLKPGDVLLLKGSRGMRVERVAEQLDRLVPLVAGASGE